jgi:hypothetical protein
VRVRQNDRSESTILAFRPIFAWIPSFLGQRGNLAVSLSASDLLSAGAVIGCIAIVSPPQNIVLTDPIDGPSSDDGSSLFFKK